MKMEDWPREAQLEFQRKMFETLKDHIEVTTVIYREEDGRIGALTTVSVDDGMFDIAQTVTRIPLEHVIPIDDHTHETYMAVEVVDMLTQDELEQAH